MSTAWGDAWPLAASTLGAPDETVDEVLGRLAATDTRWLELRATPGQLADVSLSSLERRRLLERFRAAGIRVLAVASYVRLGSLQSDGSVISDLIDHLRLAADLEAAYVRVFPGGPAADPSAMHPVEDRAGTDARMVRRLAAVDAASRELQVSPLLETHDSHPRGQDVSRVLERLVGVVPGHRVGAIWDVHHPLRAGESPERTAASLAGLLLNGRGYVQIKDAISESDLTPAAPGEGHLPLTAVFDAAARIGYRGPVSLEWERAWHPEIESMERPLAVTAAWLSRQRIRSEGASSDSASTELGRDRPDDKGPDLMGART